MPKIPGRYERDPIQGPNLRGPGVVSGNRVPVTGGPIPEALNEMARSLDLSAAVVTKIHDRRQGRAADHAKAQIAKSYSEFNESLYNRTDFENWPDERKKHAEKIAQSIDPELDIDHRAMVDSYLAEADLRNQRQMHLLSESRRIDREKTETFEDVEHYTDMIDQTLDLPGRIQLLGDVKSSLQRAEATGALRQEVGFYRWKKFENDFRRKITRAQAQNMPFEEAIAWIEGGALLSPEEEAAFSISPLDDTGKNYLMAELKSREAQRIKAEKDAEEKVFEQTNNQFVKLMSEGNLTLDMVEKSGLPPQGQMGKQWWIDRIEHRNDEIRAGKGDPFVHTTNFEAYGRLLQHAITSPESLSDEAIWELHGAGIGTAQCAKIAAVRDGKLAATPRANAKHKRWITHLNYQRQNGLWNSGDSTKAIEENNRRFMELAEELDAMFLGNPDITNEEVQEWWDDRITPDEVSRWSKLLNQIWTAIATSDFGGLTGPMDVAKRLFSPSPMPGAEVDDEEPLPIPYGESEASVTLTAEKYGMSRNQVIRMIGGN